MYQKLGGCEMKATIAINQKVSTTIFKEPEIQEKACGLFENKKELIKVRYQEILKFLKIENCIELEYFYVLEFFELCFYETLANEAVTVVFSESGNCSIAKVIADLLNEEKLEQAILGEEMVKAFSLAINSIPKTTKFLEAAIAEQQIQMLRKKFLE